MALGELVVKLSADVASFQSDMGRAVHIAQQNAARIERAFSSLKTAALGIGSSLGIGLSGLGTASFIQEIVSARAAVDDLSKITGDSVQTLDGLRRVGVAAGVGVDQLQTSLARLSRALNSADDDGKAAGAAIKALGLNIDQIRAQKPGEAMLDIALALNKFEDGASKVAVAVALMGREGARMLPFLKDLAEQGSVQGRITEEQAAQAKNLEREWRRLNLAFQDGKEVMADKVVGALDEITRAMTEAAKQSGILMAAWVGLGGVAANVLGVTDRQQTAARIGEINEQLAVAKKQLESGSLNPAGANTSFFSFLVPDVKLGAEAVAKIRATVDKLEAEKKRLLSITSPVSKEEKPILDFTLPSKLPVAPTALTAFEQLKRQLDEMVSKTGELTEAQKILNLLDTERYKTLPPAQQLELDTKKNILVALASEVDLKKSLAIYAKDQLDAEKAADDAAMQFAQTEVKRLTTLREKYSELIDPVAKYRKEFEEIAELRKKFPFMAGTLDLAELEVQKKWREEMEKGNKDTFKLSDAAHELGLTFTSAFEDAVAGGKKLSEILKSIESDILKFTTRKLVTEPFLNWADGLFKGMGGLGGSGGFPDWIGRIGNAIGGTQAPAPVSDLTLPEFAVGTPFVPRNMVAVVHRGEAIVPASDNTGGGRGVVVNMVVNTPDVGSFRASSSQIAAQLGAAVSVAARRNG